MDLKKEQYTWGVQQSLALFLEQKSVLQKITLLEREIDNVRHDGLLDNRSADMEGLSTELLDLRESTKAAQLSTSSILELLLFDAVSFKEYEDVKKILDAGISVNCRPLMHGVRSQENLIHLAVREGDIRIIELLLTYSPELNCANSVGYTPLSIAVEQDQVDIAQALLRAGADVDFECDIANPFLPRMTGITAMHHAAVKCNAQMIAFLYEQGANMSPVKIQVENPPAVRRFFNRNIERVYNRYHRSDRGETPLDIVRRIRDSTDPDDINRGVRCRLAESSLMERGALSFNELEPSTPTYCCRIS